MTTAQFRDRAAAFLALAAALAIHNLAAAASSSTGEETMAMEHQHHHHHDVQAAPPAHATRSVARYEVPDVTLTDARGQPVSLQKVLADPEPLMLNFIYTSCTSVCPAMSGVFSQVQDRLGRSVRLISISIDPEYDTPARLRDYGKRFSAGPQWILLTGRLRDSVAVQRAFSTYRGDKMDHVAATFLRAAPGQAWVRLDGLASADDLVREYRRIAGQENAGIAGNE